mmetsp:Transcript_47905/g.79372  ORF Transcript_47905/g.79372 Transcript_47905/m.79372 type:complete len:92 (-) Transcript_47905:1602-1877(-)
MVPSYGSSLWAGNWRVLGLPRLLPIVPRKLSVFEKRPERSRALLTRGGDFPSSLSPIEKSLSEEANDAIVLVVSAPSLLPDPADNAPAVGV